MLKNQPITEPSPDFSFGASYSTSTTIYKYEESIIPDPSPITVTSGDTVSQTLTETGDSSKTISVYADYDVDNPINSSSAGINFNIEQLTLNANLALDDMITQGTVLCADG